MFLTYSLFMNLLAAGLTFLLYSPLSLASPTSPKTTCALIGKAISSSSTVFYPEDAEYSLGIDHFALSAIQNSTCSVEPDTALDVKIILRILASTRIPFAIKSGGHNLNLGFSSTSGILLYMTRFNQITYHAHTNTVDIGSGLTWDQVYAALEPYNVSVVGARATGVGVGGFLLGGGYSYKTNQYGLAVDSIVAMEVVLPTGQVKTITYTSDEDLFFALRGGGNNFGIVTKFTLRTHPQTAVWGGSIIYPGTQAEAVSTALLKYTTRVTDPKTGIQCTYATYGGESLVMVNLFYDAPRSPTGIFDDFLSIPAALLDVGTRSYLSLVQSANTNLTSHTRGVYNTISHTAVTSSLLTAMRNETNVYSNALQSQSLVLNGYVVEPFLPVAYHRGTSATAYPPDRSQAIHPMNIYYAWSNITFDDVMFDAARSSAASLRGSAVREHILGSAKYPNYAISGTAVEDFYGKNVDRLRAIKRKVDPLNVMGLTGGFKL
ncbi:FAD-binding domain-containing protein [Collybia nuda]|uniref:FAD-binding domain-containing protein n=1 Tax=Collybia nuda TaxID=64659 RepID=A0A9P5XQV0_9AGAR|nr:FAD-binding domain-containing protein [Collybia nuda]